MKKKLIFFITLLVASVLFVPNAFAATPAPELVTFGGKVILLANGNEVTIEATETAGYTAVAKYEGGEVLLPAGTTIFGGMHNSTEKVDTSIIIKGGTVKNVFGGGLHISSVGTANIVVEGGTITGSIMGGGYEEFVNCGLGDFNKVTEADVMASTTRVDEANITINGGNIDGILVYGGGGAHSYTGKANITINDHEGKIAYLIAGGSNGYTGEAAIEMNGGATEVVQGVNRGSMESIEIVINGGEVTNAYAGGETPDKKVNGTFEDATLIITGGKVENVNPGTNGVAQDGSNISAKETVSVQYNKDSVTNIDEEEFEEDSIIKTVTITFVAGEESESVEIPYGEKLTEDELALIEEELTEIFAKTDYTFAGFYADKDFKEEYDMLAEFKEDATIYINFVQAKEETGSKEEIKNPNTSDINLYGTIIAMVLAGTGLGYTIKKRKFN